MFISTQIFLVKFIGKFWEFSTSNNELVNFQHVQVANNLGNAPRLFFYNELTLVRKGDVGKPMMNTHIIPNTRHRALQLARYVP